MTTISIVVIGFNEAHNLESCSRSVGESAAIPGYALETIYVDGGSTDNSIEIARDNRIDAIIGGERRRRAAENRNLGFEHARGKYVQFVDGDMILDPEWLAVAVAFLDDNDHVASLCGNIEELNRSVYSRALEIDWGVREGPIRHCGGAALWRADVLRELGGFPQDVEYGEEPYLCWRVRNELSLQVYQLDRRMVTHDLGHVSFGDYWRRNVRSGRTYAEISSRFADTDDPLWKRETRLNYCWAIGLTVLAVGTLIPHGVFPINAGFLGVIAVVLLRKALATRPVAGESSVAVMYSLHTYFSKIPLALGQIRWQLGRPTKKTRINQRRK